MSDARKDWSGGIKELGAAVKGGDKPVSERIEGLNIALKEDKRMLRDRQA